MVVNTAYCIILLCGCEEPAAPETPATGDLEVGVFQSPRPLYLVDASGELVV